MGPSTEMLLHVLHAWLNLFIDDIAYIVCKPFYKSVCTFLTAKQNMSWSTIFIFKIVSFADFLGYHLPLFLLFLVVLPPKLSGFNSIWSKAR